MKKLPEPTNRGADTELDAAIDRKRNQDYKTRFENQKAYIKSRYITYQTKHKNLETIGKSSIIVEADKKAIQSSFTESFNKKWSA